MNLLAISSLGRFTGLFYRATSVGGVNGDWAPRPLLEQWHRDRLKHEVILLSDECRDVVRSEIEARAMA